MYSLSKSYCVPPSELIKITDQLAAYCLNRAIWRFGNTVENDIADKTRNLKRDSDIQNKSRQILMKWTSHAGEIPRGMYRDPMKG